MHIKDIEKKIAELQEEVNKRKNVDKDEIYLLSLDEFIEYKNVIPEINSWWWLCSPGGLSYCVVSVDVNRDNYIVEKLGYNINHKDGAVRPALKYSNLKSKISKSNKGDDYFMYNEVRWKIIDKEKEIAIAELPIGFERFDDESNDYVSSYIRQWLLDWMGDRRMNKFKCPYTNGEKDCFIEKCNYRPCDYKDVYQKGRADVLKDYSWISVEECMPSDKGEDWVLVCAFDGDFRCIPTVAEYRNGHWWGHTMCTEDDCIDGEDSPFKVKYWKPIYDEFQLAYLKTLKNYESVDLNLERPDCCKEHGKVYSTCDTCEWGDEESE